MVRHALARGGALGVSAALACAGELPRGRSEVPVRELVPVPICSSISARARDAKASRESKPSSAAEDWALLLPGLSAAEGPWVDCTGAQFLDGEGVTGTRRSDVIWSRPRTPLGAAWLPLGAAEGAGEEAPQGGWVALVGLRAGRREVYGMGSHRGVPAATRLSLERVGPQLLVVITERRCAASGASAGCEAWADLLRLEQGRLPARARLITERALRVKRNGRWIDYQFAAELDFRPDGVHVNERLAARDALRGDSEAAELGRVLRFERGALVESAPSLLVELEAAGGPSR